MAHLEPPPGFNRYGERGLLDSIADGALDDDYYEVRPGRSSRSHGLGTLASATAVMLLALMITVAAVQNRSDRPLVQLERDALISDIGVRKAGLAQSQDRATELRKQVASLQQEGTATNPESVALRLSTAALAAAGPGVSVTISGDDASGGVVEQSDLLALVNGLWYAGAEAVAINDNRLSSTSAIGRSGQSVTVDYRSLSQPYVIVALGNKDQLLERINTNVAGEYWAQRLESIRFDVSASDDLTVPAAPANRTDVQHAEVLEGES